MMKHPSLLILSWWNWDVTNSMEYAWKVESYLKEVYL